MPRHGRSIYINLLAQADNSIGGELELSTSDHAALAAFSRANPIITFFSFVFFFENV